MSLPDRTIVLIVGAGPAGLAFALSLLHHGFRDFVIVDAISQGQNISRAIVVHAATLEALDTIGCGEELASQGAQSTSIDIGTQSSKLFSPDIESLKAFTPYPYVLIVTQNITERILEKKLAGFGISVHRPLKVVGLKRNANDPQFSDVAFEDGRVLTAKYVIGADGARSVVRTMAGIGFSDPTITETETNSNLAQMILADVTFDTTIPDNDLQISTMSPTSFFSWFALPSSYNESLAVDGRSPIFDRIHRIGCGVPLEEGDIPSSPSKEYLQRLVDRFGPHRLSSDPSVNSTSKAVRIKDVLWSSRFRNRASIADTTFTRLGPDGGAVLLIGDAAHIHSPAGGQGMNLGLRDAIFLEKALTVHIRAADTRPASEADTILREFAAARHARGLEVIRLTKGLVSVSGMKYRERFAWWCPFDSATVRAWVLWALGRVPFIRRKMAWELSGLARR